MNQPRIQLVMTAEDAARIGVELIVHLSYMRQLAEHSPESRHLRMQLEEAQAALKVWREARRNCLPA
jgi:hypothetical protein